MATKNQKTQKPAGNQKTQKPAGNQKTQKPAEGEGGVATEKANAKLEHSDSGVTTRDDRLDAGVPMLQGDASEPTGPEDALGTGPKRGDYRDRIVGEPHESVPLEGGGEPIYGDDGQIVDFKPTAALERQRPRADEIGEVAGEKGGVTTG